MTTNVHFFMMQKDILSVLHDLEKEVRVTYTEAGRYARPEPAVFQCADDIPKLGFASRSSSVASARYLICAKENLVSPRHVGGQLPYVFDQLINPETIVVGAGGVWGDNILIGGSAGTASAAEHSLRLMKLFVRGLKRRSTKVKAFWLGAEAGIRLDSGMRLTMSADSPRSHDLSRE